MTLLDLRHVLMVLHEVDPMMPLVCAEVLVELDLLAEGEATTAGLANILAVDEITTAQAVDLLSGHRRDGKPGAGLVGRVPICGDVRVVLTEAGEALLDELTSARARRRDAA